MERGALERVSCLFVSLMNPILTPPPQKKKLGETLGNSWKTFNILDRYTGRTQKQIIDFVRENYVKRQSFQRCDAGRNRFRFTMKLESIVYSADCCQVGFCGVELLTRQLGS